MKKRHKLNKKLCPICLKELQSNASNHEFCGICGMGIHNPITAKKYKTKDGKILLFCCYKCFSVYTKEILS